MHGDIHGFAFDRASGVVALCSEAFSVQLYSLFYDAEISQVSNIITYICIQTFMMNLL